MDLRNHHAGDAVTTETLPKTQGSLYCRARAWVSNGVNRAEKDIARLRQIENMWLCRKVVAVAVGGGGGAEEPRCNCDR